MKTCPVCDSDYPDQHTTCPTDGAVLIVSHELEAGSLVRGKYRIVSKLGQGGMGVVYLAEHMLLGGKVALKFLASELGKDPKFIKRFRMEARAAHQLRHPNIVEVTDLDQSEDGNLFIAMEYVAGKSLRGAMDEERSGFSVPRALEMTRGIVSGLAAAHEHGTVHRDVKPENILLAHTADGRELPKVLDFGIAAMAESATQTNMTRGLLLTPGYAAPEQWMEMSAAEMDGRTDLYAMGCILYEMLTGHTPFHAHNMEGCRRQHMEETPKPPSELRPELANWAGLDGLVMRLLAKYRDDRPQDAEVLSLLDDVQSAHSQQRQKTVAASAWERPQTISDAGQGWQKAVPALVAQPVIQTQRPASGKIPVWVWGVVVVAAGIAAIWLFAHKPQPTQTQATVTQPIIMKPLQAGANTSAPLTPSSASQKPSPATKQTPSSVTEKPAQADNSKPPIVQPPAVQPAVVTPPVQKPSINDLTRQAVSLYSQKRYTEASALFGIACTGGGWEACKDLGIMYRYGQGVTEDDAQAAGLYSKACNGDPPKGCNSLGEMYANGKGVPKDDSRAASLYTKACDAGDAMGCSNLGSMYWDGRGVPHNDSQAAALYSRACDANNAAACSNLGNCYWSGRGVGKNPDQARQLFIKSCRMNNQVACTRLKELK